MLTEKQLGRYRKTGCLIIDRALLPEEEKQLNEIEPFKQLDVNLPEAATEKYLKE